MICKIIQSHMPMNAKIPEGCDSSSSPDANARPREKFGGMLNFLFPCWWLSGLVSSRLAACALCATQSLKVVMLKIVIGVQKK